MYTSRGEISTENRCSFSRDSTGRNRWPGAENFFSEKPLAPRHFFATDRFCEEK